jgi:hypothetical protein
METNELIDIKTICEAHEIEVSFVSALISLSLIEVVQAGPEVFLPQEQLPELERLARLHKELNINPEGLDAVLHLLTKIRVMQQEMDMLKRRLRLYE